MRALGGRRVLDNTGEVLEPSLGYLDDRRLWLDIAVDCPCCFNPLMNEYVASCRP